ncbi:hypothetical protein EMCRGX_G033355 [Ephydatia muelleri]
MIVLSMADARPKAMGITKMWAHNELKIKWASPEQTSMDSTYEATLEDMMLRYLREKMSKARDKLNEPQAEEVNADDIKQTMTYQGICCYFIINQTQCPVLRKFQRYLLEIIVFESYYIKWTAISSTTSKGLAVCKLLRLIANEDQVSEVLHQ